MRRVNLYDLMRHLTELNPVRIVTGNYSNNLLALLMNRDDVRLGVAVFVQVPPAMLLQKLMRGVVVAVRFFRQPKRDFRLHPCPAPRHLLDLDRVVFDLLGQPGRQLNGLGVVVNNQVHGRHAHGGVAALARIKEALAEVTPHDWQDVQHRVGFRLPLGLLVQELP